MKRVMWAIHENKLILGSTFWKSYTIQSKENMEIPLQMYVQVNNKTRNLLQIHIWSAIFRYMLSSSISMHMEFLEKLYLWLSRIA